MTDPRLLQEIEQFFHEQIPITRAMGIRVVCYDAQQLVLEAPLDLNHNHLGTAFGGSLSAVATLAGYGMIWLALRDHHCHIVIRDSAMSFRRPVREKIHAICRLPEEEIMSAFKLDFGRKGKARITLDVTVEEQDLVAVEFQGTFVAIK